MPLDINWDKALNQLEDEDFYKELLDEYFDTTNQKLENILMQYEKNDFDSLKSEIHSLKGVSANLFLENIYEACLNAEKKIKEDKLLKEDIELIFSFYEAVKKSYNNKV